MTRILPSRHRKRRWLVRNPIRGVVYLRIVEAPGPKHVASLGREDALTHEQIVAFKKQFRVTETREERSLRLARARQRLERMEIHE